MNPALMPEALILEALILEALILEAFLQLSSAKPASPFFEQMQTSQVKLTQFA